MIPTIQFKNNTYPAFQANGFAARFCFPFADEFCTGEGVDVGCNREQWQLPDIEGKRTVVPIDPIINGLTATDFQLTVPLDFVFSSHCLEHLNDWAGVLDYWHSKLKRGGCVFLYLPDHSQVYWRPHHNRKHVNAFSPDIIRAYFKDQPEKWRDVYVSEIDLNNSFIAVAHKP